MSSGVRRGAPQGGPSPAPAAPKPEAHKPQTYEKDKNDPYANVGRNDPCPCGSGKKYKKCHAPITELMGDSASFPLCGVKPLSMPLL